ncbi:MAG: uracil-DNA glycosylase [Solirubrobacteraceae bacterium]
MAQTLSTLESEVIRCTRCPRLVEWRERAARERRASFRDQEYWGRPVPSFGDPEARLLVLGLAPAAHGGNRTGRIFTGDRSGDFLFAAMWRAGLASQPTSVSRDDGLRLDGAWVAAAVRCAPPANRPTAAELEACLPWTRAELSLLPQLAVILCLGGFAWDAALRLLSPRDGLAHSCSGGPRPGPVGGRRGGPRPRFRHGAVAHCGELSLIGSYHPSQQNTFTGRLTEAMLDEVLLSARELAGLGAPPPR